MRDTTEYHERFAQGDVNGEIVGDLPDGCVPSSAERDAQGRVIVSHSERGHHHVLPADAEVMEREERGMMVLYALVRDPGRALVQDAPGQSHEAVPLKPGSWTRLWTAQEIDPWTGQARRVAD